MLYIDDSSDSPNIKIGSRGPCCNVIKTNVLTESKEDKTLEKLNKKKSKELIVNDLQHEINIIKQEISELKHDFKDIKSDNNNLKQGHEHKDGDGSSQKIEMDPVNKLFFLVKVFLMLSLSLNLLLLRK